jgi:hypothetical protein
MKTALALPLSVLLFLVGGRFIMLLLAVEPGSDSASWILRYSEFWIRPFVNIFGLQSEAAPGGGTFEFASLLAFAAYFIAGGIVIGVISSLAVRDDNYHEMA